MRAAVPGRIVNVHEAKTHICRRIDAAPAGVTIVVAKGGIAATPCRCPRWGHLPQPGTAVAASYLGGACCVHPRAQTAAAPSLSIRD
jgi:hypothetical protein